MKWVNKNRNKYLKRYLLPLTYILLFVLLVEAVVYLLYSSFFYSFINLIILGTMLFPSIYSWAVRAKVNIQSIEINDDTNCITLTYFLYDNIKRLTCNTSHIKIELRSRYQSRGYLSIYCNGNFIGKQEYFYWKSDLDLLGLHEELKKHLPEGCVVTI